MTRRAQRQHSEDEHAAAVGEALMHSSARRWGDDAQTRPPHSAHRMRLILPFIAVAVAMLLLPSAASADDACNSSIAPARLPIVNIAILFWGPPLVNGSISQLVYPENPMLSGWTGPTVVEKSIHQTFQFYLESIADPDSVATYGKMLGLIRMLDGGTVRLNFTWFHAGFWGPSMLLQPNEFSTYWQQGHFGTLVNELAEPNGKYGRFTYIVPPSQTISAAHINTAMACERTKSCIVIAPVCPEKRITECGAYGSALTRDCVAKEAQSQSRRFDYLFTSLIDTDFTGQATLAMYGSRGYTKAFYITETWTLAAAQQQVSTALQYGIRSVGRQIIEPNGSSWAKWNTSVEDITNRVKASGAEVVIFLSVYPTVAITELMSYWRSIDYTPLSIAAPYNGNVYLPRDLAYYFLTEQTWLPSLTGLAWRVTSSPQFHEPFVSNATHDAPAVFADAFMARFGPPQLGGEYTSWSYVVFGLHSMSLMHKLIEYSQATDAESLRSAALRISRPGVFHSLSFDPFGRAPTYDYFVTQEMPPYNQRILTPLGLGRSPVLPMPTWSERVFAPSFYSTPREKLMLALTGVTMVFVLSWIGWGVAHREHAVVRASAPFFSLSVLVGFLLLLSSNFFATLHTNANHCAASVWLFTLGFSLAFSALLVKNYRIYRIWNGNQHLTRVNKQLSSYHMFALMLVVLLCDVVVNIAWSETVFRSSDSVKLIVPDPDRPAFSYYECNWGDSGAVFIYLHVGLKSALVLSAVLLAWKLRRVSSQFNESTYIGFAVYNCSLLAVLILPMLAFNVGSHSHNFLIRAYAIVFLALSTIAIMGVPKLIAVRTTVPRKSKYNNKPLLAPPEEGAKQINNAVSMAAAAAMAGAQANGTHQKPFSLVPDARSGPAVHPRSVVEMAHFPLGTQGTANQPVVSVYDAGAGARAMVQGSQASPNQDNGMQMQQACIPGALNSSVMSSSIGDLERLQQLVSHAPPGVRGPLASEVSTQRDPDAQTPPSAHRPLDRHLTTMHAGAAPMASPRSGVSATSVHALQLQLHEACAVLLEADLDHLPPSAVFGLQQRLSRVRRINSIDAAAAEAAANRGSDSYGAIRSPTLSLSSGPSSPASPQPPNTSSPHAAAQAALHSPASSSSAANSPSASAPRSVTASAPAAAAAAAASAAAFSSSNDSSGWNNVVMPATPLPSVNKHQSSAATHRSLAPMSSSYAAHAQHTRHTHAHSNDDALFDSEANDDVVSFHVDA